MADGTKAGGDAPRTLFSLGRSGKRKGRAAQASPLEDYPPRHAEESSPDTDVATLEPIDELEAGDDNDEAADEIEAAEDAATPEVCPSCSLPLVPGAVFCGECGTRVVAPEEAAAPAAVLLDEAVPGEPLPPEADGTFEVAEPVTGSLDDENLGEDDLAEDEGTELEESAVFGAFIAGDGEPEDEPEAESEAELVEDESEEEAEPAAEVEGEAEPEAELVEDEAEPEAELVEESPSRGGAGRGRG